MERRWLYSGGGSGICIYDASDLLGISENG